MSARRNVLPGFGITTGITLAYISLLILIPLTAVFISTAAGGWDHFLSAVTSPQVVASYKLTIGASFAGAAINSVFGLLVAWVLARYDFFGKRLVDAIVDLPFALPTAVAGLSLAAIYSEQGWFGRYLLPLGIKVAFTPAGILVALTFVGFPFVVRNVQPVLEDLDMEVEEAARSLGATRWQTFSRVILPTVLPALVTGSALALARALGEYGSVVFISANIPFKTQITSLLIITKLEEYDYTGATAIAAVMLLISFALLLVINLLQSRSRRFQETS
ncbi:MAG TPA: sulfate ABC transporter permease subunit CysT [Terriglobia bacterium]|nr:sulfate ABC transporter permease subunit CysT [Terriglobia bacterium]